MGAAGHPDGWAISVFHDAEHFASVNAFAAISQWACVSMEITG